MECNKCGAAIKPGNEFCGFCGAHVEAIPEIKCPECHATIEPDAKFCDRCGASVCNRDRNKKIIIITLLVAVFIIILLGVIFLLSSGTALTKKEYSSNKVVEKNDDKEKYYEISINNKQVTGFEYEAGYSYNDYYIYIEEGAITVDIEFKTNDTDYEVYNFKNYKLKEGTNELTLAKNKKSGALVRISIYLTGKHLIKNNDEEIDKLFKELEECDYWVQCSARVRFDMLSAEMTNQKTFNVDYDEEKYIKCEKEECESVATLKEYVTKKYGVSKSYAEWFIGDAIATEDLKVSNGELYFKSISVYGFETTYSYEYVGYYKDNNRIKIMVGVLEIPWDSYDGFEADQGNMIFTFINENGKYLLEDYYYLGYEFKLK